jgi:asparagine synthase (glutamine-hydrolysing)
MCGILGGWWKERPKNIESIIKRSIDSLNHRGPDDRGIDLTNERNGTLFLGQTRLSIIDLSEGGHQPRSTNDGRYTITFNGEIYNYKEIREELAALGHIFITESDTEVLLTSWVQWGKTCLTRLIGMFSFVVVDRELNTLTLVRDAFGIKPLFYSYENDSLCFASEIEAVMLLRNKKSELNNQRAYDYLISAVQDVGEDTFVKDIHHVPPSHMVVINLVKPGKIALNKWWTPSIEKNNCISFEEATKQLKELFFASIKLHLRSDVPVGIALSGGIDSSAIACITRYLEPTIDIHTFSFIPENSQLSEERWIDIVNKEVNAIPHKAVVKPHELNEDIFDLIIAQGEPFCTTSMYAQYRVFKLAKEAGVKVILEGQGADELLAGYQGYHGQRMRSLFENGELLGMFQFANRWQKWEGRRNMSPWRAFMGQIISDNLFKAMQKISGEQKTPKWINKNHLTKAAINCRPVRMTRTKTGKGRRVAEVLLDAMTHNGLASLLRYGDRNAMRFSIENRVPFLTIPLAEFLLSLPEEYLISKNGETKSIFRAAMRGLVPDVILDRRDKVGFFVPMGKWVFEMRKKLSETDLSHRELEIIDFNKLQVLLTEDIQNNESMPFQHWRVINLLLWVKQVLSPYGHSEIKN